MKATIHRRAASPSSRNHGFTLLELLTVICIVTLLSALLLPALSRSKVRVLSASCQNNLKQLQAGALLYAQDHNGRLLPNKSRTISLVQRNVPTSWVIGNARHDTSETNLTSALLFLYLKEVRLHRCPADKSRTTKRSGDEPRLRSYSIVGWLGSDLEGKGWKWPTAAIINHLTLDEIPSPSQAFSFIDEHEDSIDDGIFAICEPGLISWMELPANRHAQGCNIALIDGATAYLTWRQPKVFRYYEQSPANSADKQDLQKLQALIPLSKAGGL